MALEVFARFVVGGAPVGNTLAGTCALDGARRTVTLTGDPGISVAQAQSAVLRVWVRDNDGGTDVRLYEVTPRLVGYLCGVRTRDRLGRGWGMRSV